MLGRKFIVSDTTEKMVEKKKQNKTRNKKKKASKRKTGINYRKGEREKLRDTKKESGRQKNDYFTIIPLLLALYNAGEILHS